MSLIDPANFVPWINVAFYGGLFLVFLTAWILAEWRGVEASARRCFGGLCIGVLLACLFLMNTERERVGIFHKLAFLRLREALERGEYEHAATAIESYLADDDRLRAALRLADQLKQP